MNATHNRLQDVQSSPQPSTNGRDAKGRFVEGHAGGPGNPYSRQVAELRKEALEAVGKEQIHGIFQKMAALALDGNVQAAKFVCSYTIGKPLEGVNPDRLDADEWSVYKQTAPIMGELMQISKMPEPEIWLEMARGLRQAKTVEAAETYLTIHQRETQKEQKAAERKAKRQAKKEQERRRAEEQEVKRQGDEEMSRGGDEEQEVKRQGDEEIRRGGDEEQEVKRQGDAEIRRGGDEQQSDDPGHGVRTTDVFSEDKAPLANAERKAEAPSACGMSTGGSRSTHDPKEGGSPLAKENNGRGSPLAKGCEGEGSPLAQENNGRGSPLAKACDGSQGFSAKDLDAVGEMPASG